MKRSILLTICVFFLMSFNFYSPKQTVWLGNDNITVTVDWGGSETQDRDQEPNKENMVDTDSDSLESYYWVHGHRNDYTDDTLLDIKPKIVITLPETTYIKELKYKFGVWIKSSHANCYGFKIKADNDEITYDDCPPSGESASNKDTTGWRWELWESSIAINRYVSTFTVELEGYGTSRNVIDNFVDMYFRIYNIEPVRPDDTTDPVVTIPDLPSEPPMEIKFTVQDTESGMARIEMNCKFYRFNINVVTAQTPTPAEFHHFIGAFAPGTTDPVPITLKANGLPPLTTFSCGISAFDVAGNWVYTEKGFRVPKPTPTPSP